MTDPFHKHIRCDPYQHSLRVVFEFVSIKLPYTVVYRWIDLYAIVLSDLHRKGICNVWRGTGRFACFFKRRAKVVIVVVHNALQTLHTLVVIYFAFRRNRLNIALVIAHGAGLSAFFATCEPLKLVEVAQYG